MKKTIRIIAVLLVLIFVLSGCKKTVENAPDTTGTPVTNGSGSATVDKEPADGRTDKSDVGSTGTTGSTGSTGTPAPAATAAPGMLPGYSAGESGESGSSLSPSDLTGSSSEDPSSSVLTDFLAKFDSKSLTDSGSADAALGTASDESFVEFPKESAGAWDLAPEGLLDGAAFIGGDYDMSFEYGDIIGGESYRPTPKAGLLTAGEWNDNRNFSFLKSLLANGQDDDFSRYFRDWNLCPFSRIVIHAVCEDGTAMANAQVKVYSADGSLMWSCRTDSAGMAYAYYSVLGTSGAPATVKLSYGGSDFDYAVTAADLDENAVIELSFGSLVHTPKALDLMFMIDTTGSMWDELAYLQAELEDVITRVKDSNPNLTLRLSVNFYRDMEDTYIVRSYPFSANIDEELRCLKAEYADGGGDYEEAVELALDDAVNNHEWSEDAVKLMFLVLDAPPHNTQTIRESLASTLEKAVQKGIRVIPVASSGVDKNTEFLLRTFAMVTGGTYTFLTDDSGIGGSHITPTIGDYVVEQLCDLLVRLIDEYLTGNFSAPVPAEIPERPTDPVDPVTPIDPWPIDPIDPYEPIDPIEPWPDPVDPDDPIEPIPYYPPHSNSTLIVSVVEGTTEEAIEAICAKYTEYGLSIKYNYGEINAFALQTERDLSDAELFALKDSLAGEDCITEVSLDYIYTLDDPVIPEIGTVTE